MSATLFTDTFDALFGLEKTICEDVGLRHYDWQPRARPNVACMWNWIVPDGNEASWPIPGMTHRDVFVVRATIAVVEKAGDQKQVRGLMEYVDAFTAVIDPVLMDAADRPWLTFPSCAIYAQRNGMSNAFYGYAPNDPPLLAMDFPIRLQIDRNTFE